MNLKLIWVLSVLILSQLAFGKEDRSLCIDGVAILHHSVTGKIRRVPFGGCGNEQRDYYREQVESKRAQGERDLVRDSSPHGKKLLQQVYQYEKEKGHSPGNSFQLEGLVNSLAPSATASVTSLYPLSEIPVLNSRPGAKATLYLDFNGHFEPQWGGYFNVTSPAYDTDGDATTFSAAELANIQTIWKYTSEHFAPFNINVTTVEPASFANGVALRAVIGGDSKWTGKWIGGVAYGGSFTNFIVNTCYIFSLSLGYPSIVAAVVSHESGHSFGLDHQSQWSGGSLVQEYYMGPKDGTAPIMGDRSGAIRGPLWWYGTPSYSATTYQDDFAILSGIQNGFGLNADDYGDTAGTASALADNAGGLSADGIIGTVSDKDYFSFYTSAGTVTVTADSRKFQSLLDPRIEIQDGVGNVRASTSGLGAKVSANLEAGEYFAVVSSSGASLKATANDFGFNIGPYSLSVATGVQIKPPLNLTATAISSNYIKLNWLDSDNESGYKIEQLKSTVWESVATLPANTISWQSPYQTSLTTYTYRVVAYNVVGEIAYSNAARATTPRSPDPLLAPSNLVASSIGSNFIQLTWQDNATNEDGFRIQRLSRSGVWVNYTYLWPGCQSYTVNGLLPEGTYTFRVAVYNNSGDTAYSGSITASTLAPSPLAPSNVTVTAVSSTEISLSWIDNTSDEIAFKVYRECGDFGSCLLATLPANSTSWQAVGLVAGETYYFWIVASSSASYSSPAIAGTTLPGAPLAPAILTAATVSSSQINLSWSNVASETGYKIERSLDQASWIQIATTATDVITFSSTGLAAGTTYYYRVRATNSYGDSPYSFIASARTNSLLVLLPKAPSNLSATYKSKGKRSIGLTWVDNANNETSQSLERSDNGGVFLALSTLGANSTSYSDANNVSGHSYGYRIRACNASGCSAYANSSMVVVP